MLEPSRDRLDYSRIIMPPAGYRFDSAVGTTYSLDLAALLGIPVALVLGQSPDTRLCKPGIPLLEALRKAAGKVALFSQAGRISVPHEQRELYALLEKSIAQVLPPDEFSFHPKVWVIKYSGARAKSDVLFRVVVLSRNLTFDRSWDVAAVLDGTPTGAQQEDTKPLVGFLEYLAEQHPDAGMRRMVRRLATEVSYVSFEPQEKRFQHVRFYPMGIPGSPSQTPFDQTLDCATVISPFLSKSRVVAIRDRLSRNGRMVLISRRTELDKLANGTLDGIECWHMKDEVVDGEGALDETEVLPASQDIHAKLYLTTRYSWSRLWLGSANCSEKGFSGNIEFMLRLEGYRRYCNQDMLLKDLFGEKEDENPFMKYEPPEAPLPPPDDTEDRVLERLARDIFRSLRQARACVAATDAEAGRYRVEIDVASVPPTPPGFAATIEPLCRQGSPASIAERLVFTDLTLAQLNTMYAVRISKSRNNEVLRSFVVMIPTEGIPDSRNSAIYKSVIASQEEFFAYIAFILGEDYALAMMDQTVAGGRFQFGRSGTGARPVVYEKMLRAASRRPEALAEVREIIELCAGEGNVISQEFRDLYAKFEAVAAGRKKKR